MSTEKINVAVRIRPRLAEEEGRQDIVNIENGNIVRISDGEKYLEVIFDNIFPPSSSNQQVYHFLSHGVLQTLQGENCSVMAFGPTSSGKTYTIFGSNDLNNGLVGYSLHDLYAAIDAQGSDKYRVEVSFYCIENERIFDLFQDYQPKMNVVNDPLEGLIVECSRTLPVNSKQHAFEIIRKGLAKAEELNRQGVSIDFSHKILVFKIHTNFPDEEGYYLRGKCVFCDLAGSERKRRNGLTSVNPSIHILTSLLMGKGKEPLTAADSRVSQVIRDCLPPNSRTYFIATVAPIIETASECLKTLNVVQGVQKKTTNIRKFKFHFQDIEWLGKYRKAIQNVKKQLESAGVIKEEVDPPTPPDFLEPYIQKYIALKSELESLRQSSYYDTSSQPVSDEPNNQDLSILLGKRGAELQEALEILRKKEIEVAAAELKSKLPAQGRCPVCTLKIPCKHYEKMIDIPPVPAMRGRSLSPLLNISTDSRKPDISFVMPKNTTPATTGGRNFRVRYRGATCSVEKSVSPTNQSQIWQDSKRLKLIEKLEAYKEEKLRREIELIEELKRKEMQDSLKERKAEEKRRKYIEKQKQKLQEYHQEQEKKKEAERERMRQLEKSKKKDNISKNYLNIAKRLAVRKVLFEKKA